MRGSHLLAYLLLLLFGHGLALSLLRSPLWEPPLQEYFTPLQNFTPSSPLDADFVAPTAQIPRLRNISSKEFKELVTHGQPFVVDDCGAGAEFLRWSCQDYAKKWPTGKMRAEYSPGQQNFLLSQGEWYKKARPTSTQRQHLSNGTRLAGPYIWHVKDHEPETGCSSKTDCWPVKKSVQQHWKAPYFLRDREVNALEAKDSFEFWFGLAGGGALAHADAYNEMTLSFQYRGTKTWRLAMHPAVATAFDSFDSQDGGVYTAKKWLPEYDFSLQPGECFVFPPGYFHETLVKVEDNEEDPCTVATTFQFIAPFPARYWRSFLPRWMNSHLGWQEEGAEHWGPIATVSHMALKPSLNASLVESKALALLQELDGNRDSFVSRADLLQHFSSPRGYWATTKDYAWLGFLSDSDAERARPAVAAELAEAYADAVIAFHDLDFDERISGNELYTSLWQWNVLLWRKQRHKALRRRAGKGKAAAELKRFEEKFIRDFGDCDGPLEAAVACERLQQLAAETQLPAANLRRISLFISSEDEEDHVQDDEL